MPTKNLAKVMRQFFESNEVFYLQPVFGKVGGNAASCSTYAAGTLFCADGSLPTCSITRAKAFQITGGMSYDQVVRILGCHGALGGVTTGRFNIGSYTWGAGTQIMGVTFSYGSIAGLTAYPAADSTIVVHPTLK
jgi:hypothetical protein